MVVSGSEVVLDVYGVGDPAIRSVEHLEGNRFRFYFVDSSPPKDVPLFN